MKVWDVSGRSGGWALTLSWGFAGLESTEASSDIAEDNDAPGATSVEALKADLKKIAVAYQNAVVKIFEIETGKEVSRLATDIGYGEFYVLYSAPPYKFFDHVKMEHQPHR